MALSLDGINAALSKCNNKILAKATLLTTLKEQAGIAETKLELFERIRKRLLEAKRAIEMANENASELE